MHIAPPPVAADLIRRGANPNVRDSRGRTALDWAVQLPEELRQKPVTWTPRRRYEMCNVLLNAGGTLSGLLKPGATAAALDDFAQEGLDIAFLARQFREQVGAAGDAYAELEREPELEGVAESTLRGQEQEQTGASNRLPSNNMDETEVNGADASTRSGTNGRWKGRTIQLKRVFKFKNLGRGRHHV